MSKFFKKLGKWVIGLIVVLIGGVIAWLIKRLVKKFIG